MLSYYGGHGEFYGDGVICYHSHWTNSYIQGRSTSSSCAHETTYDDYTYAQSAVLLKCIHLRLTPFYHSSSSLAQPCGSQGNGKSSLHPLSFSVNLKKHIESIHALEAIDHIWSVRSVDDTSHLSSSLSPLTPPARRSQLH
jgi:hypothetical protein